MKAKVLSQVHHERMVLWRKIPLRSPWVIYIEPSGYCNLKCRFCPHGKEERKLTNDIMTFEVFKKLIDDLTVFPDKVKLLRFCGNGEPLFNKNIIKMLRYARKRKVAEKIELVTNGLLISRLFIEELPQFLDRIIFSIEGLSLDDYQSVCQTKVDFGRLLRNLKLLFVRKKNCKVHIKIHSEAVASKSRETR